MDELKYSEREVSTMLSAVVIRMDKDYRFMLMWRSFTSAIVGFFISGLLFINQVPLAPIAGAAVVVLFFSTLDHTIALLLDSLHKRMEKKKET